MCFILFFFIFFYKRLIFNLHSGISQIIAEVEVYPEDNFTKEIIGGSVGGLALLALITLALYKVRHSS